MCSVIQLCIEQDASTKIIKTYSVVRNGMHVSGYQ